MNRSQVTAYDMENQESKIWLFKKFIDTYRPLLNLPYINLYMAAS